MQTRSQSAQWLRSGLVALVVACWLAVAMWFWYRLYRAATEEPAYNLSRVPGSDEISAALRTSCVDSERSSELVPALRLPPDYPEPARRKSIEGAVELEFLVSSGGSVTDVRVTKSDPPGVFDRAAIHAVSHWHYCPRTESQNSRVQLAFKLSEAEKSPLDCNRFPLAELQLLCRLVMPWISTQKE